MFKQYTFFLGGCFAQSIRYSHPINAFFQIYLLLVQKNYGGKFNGEKVAEQIIHDILCDMFTDCCANLKLCCIIMINTSYCVKSHWNRLKSTLLIKF